MIDRTRLLLGLKIAEKIIGSNPIIPINEMVRIFSANGELYLWVISPKMALSFTLGKYKDTLDICIEPGLLAKAASAAPETLAIELDGERAVIKTKKGGRVKIPVIAGSEYPQVKMMNDPKEVITTEGGAVADAIILAASMCSDVDMAVHSGLHIAADGEKMYVVGTDTHKVFMYDKSTEANFSTTISKDIGPILKALPFGEDMDVIKKGNYFGLASLGWEITFNEKEGSFPLEPIQKMMEEEMHTKLHIQPKEFHKALKYVAGFSEVNLVDIKTDKKVVTILNVNEQGPAHAKEHADITAPTEGEIDIRLNADLMDIPLKTATDDGACTILVNESATRIRINTSEGAFIVATFVKNYLPG